MLGAWPEPFGLVAIESMATGTPVIARRAGALPEIVEHGRSGFLVDDLQEAILAVERASSVDRALVRQLALGRFSVARMIDDYERVYGRLFGRDDLSAPDDRTAVPILVEGRSFRGQDEAAQLVGTTARREAG
jgi:hypothetical protein